MYLNLDEMRYTFYVNYVIIIFLWYLSNLSITKSVHDSRHLFYSLNKHLFWKYDGNIYINRV